MPFVRVPNGKKRIVQKRRVKTRAEQGYVRMKSKNNCTCLRFRLVLTAFGMCLGFSYIGVRLGHVALVPAHEPRISIRELPKIPVRRGNIYDTKGELLATTLEVPSVFADPKGIMDVEETVNKLEKVLSGVCKKHLTKILSDKKRRFVWVQRHITPAKAFAINSLGLPGIGFRTEQVRVYPHRQLAAHVLGGINIDGKGVAGIEAGYDKSLVVGEDVKLTLDGRIQQQLRISLVDAMEKAEAKAAWGIVLDAKTGDVRAMTSLPDYDPNSFGKATEESKFNSLTFGRYEMGSTFKLLTLAQGFAENIITPETMIDCRKPLKVGKYTIRDYHAQKRIMSAKEVLRHSSNIGAGQIADAIGGDRQRGFFRELGLLDPLDVGLPETVAPRYPARWGRIHTITMAYGHGISITPMQMVAAVSALSTDGIYRHPRLVEGEAYEAPRTVVAPEVVTNVKNLMRDAVVMGTGWRARVRGLDIGGKTGTAEKVAANGYSESKNRVSFVGTVPLDDPELVILVMLDEPSAEGMKTAGRAAAPAFKSFVKRAAPFMAFAPSIRKSKPVQVAKSDINIEDNEDIDYQNVVIKELPRNIDKPVNLGRQGASLDKTLKNSDKWGNENGRNNETFQVAGAVVR